MNQPTTSALGGLSRCPAMACRPHQKRLHSKPMKKPRSLAGPKLMMFTVHSFARLRLKSQAGTSNPPPESERAASTLHGWGGFHLPLTRL
jgi:hypothetical protein